MATSQELAEKAIQELTGTGELGKNTAKAIAQALAQNDLLIPHAHIPEPSYCVQEFGDIYLGQSLEWEDFGISMVFGKRVGGDKGAELFAEGQEFSNSENVRTYAAYLLEAAKRMKEIEDLEKYGI